MEDMELGEQARGHREDAESTEGHIFCAVCLEKILIQETALVKGCEHAYCYTLVKSLEVQLGVFPRSGPVDGDYPLRPSYVALQTLYRQQHTSGPSTSSTTSSDIQSTAPAEVLPVHSPGGSSTPSVTCILRWATYQKNPSCPQCKHPFEFLNVHRSLDGRIHDYMFEESVCLLLRATWFIPLTVESQGDAYEEEDPDHYYYDENNGNDDSDEEDGVFFTRGIRIGNRRWGNSGYVRAGRKEARPVNWQFPEESDAGTSQQPKKEASSCNAPPTGRRAKRALKREAADKAAAAKHEQQLQRLGLK